jgi:hypothetical protein
MTNLFHIENLVNGQWKTFTSDPIEGREAAEAHLLVVQKFATGRGKSKDDVRIRELSEEEMVKLAMTHLTPHERDDIVAKAIHEMGPVEFWRKVNEARIQNALEKEKA